MAHGWCTDRLVVLSDAAMECPKVYSRPITSAAHWSLRSFASHSLPACLPSSPVISVPCHCSSPPLASWRREWPSFDLECSRDRIAPCHEDIVHSRTGSYHRARRRDLGSHGRPGARRLSCDTFAHCCTVAQPNGARGHRGSNRKSDPRHHAGRARPLSPLHRHAVRLHLRRQLVVAGSRRRTADGPPRDRCGACAHRLRRGDLVRHSRGRRRRLSRDLRPTDPS